MASLVQSANASWSGGTTASPTWGASPTAGNFLVVIIGAGDQGVDVSTIANGMVETPEGLVTFGGNGWIRAYTKLAEGTESTKTSTIMDSNLSSGFIWAGEYSGVGQLDSDASTTGSDDTPTGSNPGQGDLNILGVVAELNGGSMSSPPSGWAEVVDLNDSTLTFGVIHHLSGDSDDGSVTLSSSADWATMHLSITELFSVILRLRAMGY